MIIVLLFSYNYKCMPILDAIPVNWFIVGTSVLAGVILFLILTQVPDEELGGKEEKVTAKKASKK